ncbi:hypothetical protein IWW54_004524, partial [Coemansia sp. RSA 2705]
RPDEALGRAYSHGGHGQDRPGDHDGPAAAATDGKPAGAGAASRWTTAVPAAAAFAEPVSTAVVVL